MLGVSTAGIMLQADLYTAVLFALVVFPPAHATCLEQQGQNLTFLWPDLTQRPKQ